MRRQLTLFVPLQVGGEIEACRQRLDPHQAGLIAAHVTVCREDELNRFAGAGGAGGIEALRCHVDGLREDPAGGLSPIELGFATPEPFSGHGWWMRASAGQPAFAALRRRLLDSEVVRDAQAHLTLAHPRNPQAEGNVATAAARLGPCTVTFPVLSLIEQEAGAPWRSLATWPLGPAGRPSCPRPAGGLVAGWLERKDRDRLQEFYRHNPDYFLMVEGRPPGEEAAHDDLSGPLPPGIDYRERWGLGWFDAQGRLQAFCSVVRDMLAPGVWHIGLFIVASPLHGLGIARQVHASIETWARENGARWLRLGVVIGNRRGERFWARNGYVEVRQRHDIPYGDRRHSLGVLIKPLAGGTISDYLSQVPRDRPDA